MKNNTKKIVENSIISGNIDRRLKSIMPKIIDILNVSKNKGNINILKYKSIEAFVTFVENINSSKVALNVLYGDIDYTEEIKENPTLVAKFFNTYGIIKDIHIPICGMKLLCSKELTKLHSIEWIKKKVLKNRGFTVTKRKGKYKKVELEEEDKPDYIWYNLSILQTAYDNNEIKTLLDLFY